MRRTSITRKQPLSRKPLSKGSGLTLNRKPISPASKEQRSKVRELGCIVCAQAPADPAHIIDRSLGGDDNPAAVVPLCRTHHREYDDGRLSLLEYLEPAWRDELAYAVRLVGLLSALQRITNLRWTPEEYGKET